MSTRSLRNKIIEIIKGKPEQAITFRDYMALCLYDADGGYYMKEREKIGPDGDFYTSASIGGIMGEVLARYIAGSMVQWDQAKPAYLVEWGGGTGLLARQILDELRDAAPAVYGHLQYISVEKSPAHRAAQADRLHEHKGIVRWMTDQEWLQQGPWEQTIVLSNELLDAFPVHRVQIRGGMPHEIQVAFDETGKEFIERYNLINEGPVLDYVLSLGVTLTEGQQLEVNLEAVQWIRRVGQAVGSGEIITIDYGDEAEELYAAHRFHGTLMCYAKHQADMEPYLHPGNQDMTSHVNFSKLMQEGTAIGLATKHYWTQKQFLVENGILQLLQDTATKDPFSPAAKRNRAVRQLLLSDQMSELFKVLIQKKGELP